MDNGKQSVHFKSAIENAKIPAKLRPRLDLKRTETEGWDQFQGFIRSHNWADLFCDKRPSLPRAKELSKRKLSLIMEKAAQGAQASSSTGFAVAVSTLMEFKPDFSAFKVSASFDHFGVSCDEVDLDMGRVNLRRRFDGYSTLFPLFLWVLYYCQRFYRNQNSS